MPKIYFTEEQLEKRQGEITFRYCILLKPPALDKCKHTGGSHYRIPYMTWEIRRTDDVASLIEEGIAHSYELALHNAGKAILARALDEAKEELLNEAKDYHG